MSNMQNLSDKEKTHIRPVLEELENFNKAKVGIEYCKRKLNNQTVEKFSRDTNICAITFLYF